MRKTLLMSGLAVMAMLAFVPVSSAGAVELNGGWAPHNRCPVDDPGMLGGSTPACVAASAASGTFKLGKQTVATGATNLQFGVDIGAGGLPFNPLFPGTGGAIQADPVEVPGGLLGLACNAGGNAAVTALCNTIKGVTDPLNKVTATVESAGPPADFDSLAALLGGPILTLPVKIHLSNPLLGGKCYIGSDDDPIVLHPEGVGNPTFEFFSFDPDGTLNPSGDYAQIVLTGTQQDDSFAAPKAHGCGLKIPLANDKYLLDGAVNNKVGLPSPSGNNLLVLDDAVSNVTGSNVGVDGQTFSDDWHSAILP